MISVSKNVITKLFKDTTLIENRDLAYEVYLVNDLWELYTVLMIIQSNFE